MNICHWIERHAAFSPNKIAIYEQAEQISYANLAGQISRTASALKHQLGIGYGDRIAYLGYNSTTMLALLFAAARLGALLVPLNWRLAAREHAYILQNAGVKTLFCQSDFQPMIDGLRPEFPQLQTLACDFSAPHFSALQWLSLQQLCEAATGDDHNPNVDLSAPLLIVYTSGTTGKPKGAVLKQEALFWNALNSLHAHDLSSNDKILTMLPMFHVGGLNIQTTPALYAGASVVLEPRFTPAAFYAAIDQHRPTLAILVPATMQAVISHPLWQEADFSCLRLLNTGSSIVPAHLIHTFNNRGVPTAQIYGSTETCPVAIYQRREDADKVGTTGKVALHCELRIIDTDGNDVATGESGEVLIRGGNLLSEYWGDEQATQAALRDGWYHTEDIAYQDKDGYVYIKERKKELIISGGENIYPAEVEAILHNMSGIREAAVIGRAHERWGEVPVAVVVLEQSAELSEEDILAGYQNQLARFKHPHAVIFVESLPRNSIGKVQKFLLKETLFANPERAIT